MTRRLATICIAAILSVGLTSPPVQAQHTAIRTLKGISAVSVLIEELPDGAKVLGISEDTIKTDVELKLRLAGMRVVTQEEDNRLPGGPYVYVNLNLTANAAAAAIAVELCQDAKLERNDQDAPGVSTWRVDYVMLHPNVEDVRNIIKDGVDHFLNAWLSVNPKK